MDIAKRFPQNPLLSPSDLKSSKSDLEIICLLNPGVFRYQNKIWLIVRVAESAAPKEGSMFLPFITELEEIKVIEVPLGHAELITTDPRVANYQGMDYLTTLSHLRLLCSDDGIKFYEPENGPSFLFGKGALERFGIEDCRVTQIGSEYFLTYTAVSSNGVGVGLRTTSDWKTFVSHGMIIPPHNKDCAIFEEKINGLYYALHRPSSVDLGGNYIWLAESPDAIHWGNHKCLVRTRKDHWDNARVGAGAAPVKTSEGWLEIYHGANYLHQYCLGAFLLDLNDPSKVLARTDSPIMVPAENYELSGFFGHVVFTNGHFLDEDGDTLTVYYGAADEFVCAAHFSVKEILSKLDYMV
jgi:predicted GH43/DUF377 family glycosyl hydrolase